MQGSPKITYFEPEFPESKMHVTMDESDALLRSAREFLMQWFLQLV